MRKQRKIKKPQILVEPELIEEDFELTEEDRAWVRENLFDPNDFDSDESVVDPNSYEGERVDYDLEESIWNEIERQHIEQGDITRFNETTAIMRPEKKGTEILDLPRVTNDNYGLMDLDEATGIARREQMHALEIRKRGERMEKGLERAVWYKARDIESKYRTLFEKGDIYACAKLVLDNLDYVLDLTKEFVPEKALMHMNFKWHRGWSSTSYPISTDHRNATEAMFEKTYKFEKELLEAQHPRRVERLWKEAKPKLESRYHRVFSHREDFAVMNAVFDEKKGLIESVERLKEALEHTRRIKEFAEAEPNLGWEEKLKLYEDYCLESVTASAAKDLIKIMADMTRPSRFFRNFHWEGSKETEEEVESLTSHRYTGRADDPHIPERNYNNTLSYWQADLLSNIVLETKRGAFPFPKALKVVAPEYCKPSGVGGEERGIEGWNHSEVPDETRDFIYSEFKRLYEQKDKAPREFTQFMRWFSGRIKDRWSSTATDHEKLFAYHEPGRGDKELIDFFYTIRDGKKPDRKDDRAYLGRLPEVLKAMIKDGIIEERDVDPPLKEKYLLPTELLSQGGDKLIGEGKKLEDIIKIKMRHPVKIIETENPGRQLPAFTTGTYLPVQQDNLKSLKDTLDPSKKYFVLYSSDQTVFISSEEFYPTGKRMWGDIYKFLRVKEDAKIDESKVDVLRINGQRYVFKKEFSYAEERKMREAAYDTGTDIIPAKGYTAIVDISPADFQKTYLRDFVAHALLNRSRIDIESIQNNLKNLDKIVKDGSTKINMWLGSFVERTQLSTFELGGRFAFTLRHKNEADPEVTNIARFLLDYINQAGLSYHLEAEDDEGGRRIAQKKLDDRAYVNKHMQEVLESLKGNGLANILTHALVDNNFSVRDFGRSYKACEHCGEYYIQGQICRQKPQYDQWGIWAEDLHTLARHPQTFKDSFDKFRKVYDLVSDSKETIPIFIQYPEIMPEFREFITAYNERAHAESIAYNNWEATQGGLEGQFEEEEIEDDPALRGAIEEERLMSRDESTFRDRSDMFAARLEKKYRKLKGEEYVPKMEEDWKITSFWSQQIMIYSIYQHSAPKLLTAIAGENTLEEMISLRRVF